MPYLGNEVAPLVQALEGKELKIDSDGDSSIQASADDTVVFKTNSNTALKIDANGHITKPLQSAFLATVGSQQNNLTNDGSLQTVTFSSEVFDQNSDFNTSNFTFTAPVTGKYIFNLMLFLLNIDTGATYYSARMITSNRTYTNDMDPSFQSDLGRYSFVLSVLADMDASDTVTIQILQVSGASQTDIAVDSFFSGYLVC